MWVQVRLLDILCNRILILYFFTSASTAASGLGLSTSASVVSLQQAFLEMRQGHFDPGPSTAPPMLHTSMPPLLPPVTPVPSGTAPMVSPPLAHVSEVTYLASLPTVSANPRGSTSPPPTLQQTPTSAMTSTPTHSLPMSQPPLPPSQPSIPTGISVITSPSSLPVQAAITMPVSTPFPQATVPVPALGSMVASLPHPVAPVNVVGSVSGGSAEHPFIPSTTAQLTPTVVPTTAFETPQLATSTIPTTVIPSADSQPQVPTLQPVTTNSQPQTSTVPNQSHIHCVDCDSDPQGKGVDDIQALDKKLRSLFMDLGSGPPSAQSDITSDPMATPSIPGTSSPTTSATPSGTPLPPSSLPLSTSGLQTGSPMTAMGNGSTPVGYSQTTPSKAPLSRLPVSDG